METIKITVRLPEDLHEALVRMAAGDDRSLNSLLISLLRKAVESEPPK
jgi:predicted HicB family RNase H-like nuclease